MATDTIVRVDPKTLLVGPNVRKVVTLGKEFVESIKQHGVLVPITAQETGDGKLEVIDGQRRTLAAVDGDVAEVPVFVTGVEIGAERIVDQLVVNEHRSGITDADQVAAIRELSLFDLPATAIAQKVGMSKGVVETAIAVGASERAVTAMREQQVSFEAAAILAEFEGDEEAQTDLVSKAADGWGLTHPAQAWRDKRAIAAIEAEIDAMEGVTLIQAPGYNQFDPLSVSELFLDEERQKPLAKFARARLAKLAGEGLCAYASLEWAGQARKPVIKYAVKGWQDLGLFTYSWKTSGSTKPATPEDAEKLKAERRAARESTKSWVSASAVRLQFLQELVVRRTPPTGWQQWVGARLLTNDPFPNAGWKMAIAILQLTEGRDAYSQRAVVEKYFESTPKSAPQIMLAAALGAIEGGYEFDRKGWQAAHTPAYLKQLQEWGYELSELEQSIVAPKRSRKAVA